MYVFPYSWLIPYNRGLPVKTKAMISIMHLSKERSGDYIICDDIKNVLPINHTVSTYTYNETIPLKGDELVIDSFTKKYDFKRNVTYTTEEDVIEIARTMNGSWAHLKNLYVNNYNTYSEGQYIYAPEIKPTTEHLRDNMGGACIGTVDHLVAVGHRYNYKFGHWFLDGLFPLMLIPEDIKRKSMIVLQCVNYYIKETLTLQGIYEDQWLVLEDEEDWVFAKNLYVVYNPMPYLSHFSTAIVNFSRKFSLIYGLNKIEARDFALSNREKFTRRYITNFNLFVLYVNIEFPKYKWIELKTTYASIRESAIDFARLKFLFIPTGSNMIPILFMKSGGMIVDMQTGFNDHAMESIALCVGLKIIAFSVIGVHHYNTDYYEMNIQDGIRIMQIAIYAFENGKWPNRGEY